MCDMKHNHITVDTEDVCYETRQHKSWHGSCAMKDNGINTEKKMYHGYETRTHKIYTHVLDETWMHNNGKRRYVPKLNTRA